MDIYLYATAAKSLQSCPTLCDPIDGSPPGSATPGTLQARTLEWVAISFSNAWKWKVKVKMLSQVQLLATPWTAAYQAPPSMGFSRQEYWSGVPLPPPITIWATSKAHQTHATCWLHETIHGWKQIHVCMNEWMNKWKNEIQAINRWIWVTDVRGLFLFCLFCLVFT